MAGSYADAIGPRIPYDIDGTQSVSINSINTVSSVSQASLAVMNDEDGDGVSGVLPSHGSYVMFFPYATDLQGIFMAVQSTCASGISVETSSNTTTGLDGTWTAFRSAYQYNDTFMPNYRTGVYANTASAITALRLSNTCPYNTQIDVLHLYGKPSSFTDKIEFWHPTLDQSLNLTPAYLDFGDIARGSGPVTRTYRIKNRSSTLTAQGITVAVESATPASPSVVSQMQLSYNGGAYGSSISVGNLAPGAISSVADLKFDPLSTAQLSVWTQRLRATVTSWV